MNFPDHSFPPLLDELYRFHKFEYDHQQGVDFEPYPEFLDNEQTNAWFQAWTGNDTADASSFRIFGQEASGAYVGFWIINSGKSLLKQPVVFLGSNGESGVIASNFDAFLWLLAQGIGPCDAVCLLVSEGGFDKQYQTFAEQNSSVGRTEATEIIKQAKEGYPTFLGWLDSLCEWKRIG